MESLLLGLHRNPTHQRRTRTWAKSAVPSQREAQREADQFMETVNERNNQPHLFTSDDETVQAVYKKCRELTWPHLKNSTRKQYEENFKTLPAARIWQQQAPQADDVELQAYFNSLSPAFAEVDPADSRHASRRSQSGNRVGACSSRIRRSASSCRGSGR